MKKISQFFLFALVSTVIFTSCENVTSKVETQLNELTDKAGRLDSIIDTEMNKVEKLDSVINLENLKIKKIDSIVEKSSTKLDSIWKKYN